MDTPETGSPPRWRAAIDLALFALLIVGASLALDALARWQLRAHLVQSAQATLGAIAHGDTPLRWSLTDRGELVSGAAFGTPHTDIDSGGTRVTGVGAPVELGLHLDGVIDLQRFPILQVDLDVADTVRFALVVRESLDGPLCMSDALELPPGTATRHVDVVERAWTCDGVRHDVPTRAAMLRLQFNLASGARVRAANARLLPIQPISASELGTAMPTPVRWMSQTRELRTIDVPSPANLPGDAWPIFTLTLEGRVEQSMQAIDHIRDTLPAAVIVAEGDWPAALGGSREWSRGDDSMSQTWLAWALVVVHALVLLWIRLRPLANARGQALLELLGVLAVPLVLVIGGGIGNDLGAPVVMALLLTLAFAASLLRGSVAPRQPAARMWMRGTAVALATVMASVVIVLVLRDGGSAWAWPSAGNTWRYVGWAAVQQLLVGVIVADRFERIFGSARWALPASAIVFALLHTPNAMLMQFTLLAGLVWVWNWQHHRALLANTIAHAASGLLLATQLPPDWLRSAEVSARYFLF